MVWWLINDQWNSSNNSGYGDNQYNLSIKQYTVAESNVHSLSVMPKKAKLNLHLMSLPWQWRVEMADQEDKISGPGETVSGNHLDIPLKK